MCSTAIQLAVFNGDWFPLPSAVLFSSRNTSSGSFRSQRVDPSLSDRQTRRLGRASWAIWTTISSSSCQTIEHSRPGRLLVHRGSRSGPSCQTTSPSNDLRNPVRESVRVAEASSGGTRTPGHRSDRPPIRSPLGMSGRSTSRSRARHWEDVRPSGKTSSVARILDQRSRIWSPANALGPARASSRISSVWASSRLESS